MEARAAQGKSLSAREVDDVVKSATNSDGKPDGDSAVVIAEAVRSCPHVFGGGHRGLLKFLARVAWRALMVDLHLFMAQLNEEATEARKKDELKRSLVEDRLDQDTRAAQLLRMGRLKSDRLKQLTQAQSAPKNTVLDEDSKMRMTLEHLRRR